MKTITVEIDEAESTCARCGTKGDREVHAVERSRMRGYAGPDRLVVTASSLPDGWDHLRAPDPTGTPRSWELCPTCKLVVAELLGRELKGAPF